MAELLVPGEMPSHWRDALRAIAHRAYAAFEPHPWPLDVSSREPIATPNLLRHVEQSAAAVAGLGLDPATATAMVGATDDYTIGCVSRRRFRDRSQGKSLLDSSERLRPELRSLLESGELPLVSGWAAGGGRLDLLDDSFDRGLEWLFDGMEAMLAGRRDAGTPESAGHGHGYALDGVVGVAAAVPGRLVRLHVAGGVACAAAQLVLPGRSLPLVRPA